MKPAAVSQPERSHAIGSMRRELARKAIHLTGLAVPVLYFFTPRLQSIAILAALAATSIAIDFVRHRNVVAAAVFNSVFDPILRDHERDREARNLTAVSWFFVAAVISAAIFPKYITIASLAMSLPADAASAVVGTAWGRHRIMGSKSLEGSLAFFAAALAVGIVMSKIEGLGREYVIAAAAALVGAVVELVPSGLDDNFTTPLSMAACLWALYRLMLPHLDLQFGV
jgi:dolichol kinase